MADFDDRSGRDSRLLALVIVIAVVVLVGLARFRFPQAESRPTVVTPGPLERLAARATYDDLAAAVHTSLQRVEPALVFVNLEPDSPGSKGGARRMAGVRLDGEWAVVHVPPGFRVAKSPEDDPLTVRHTDAAREIVVVTRPLAAAEDKLPSGTSQFSGFAYVMVVEPTDDGPTASPAFVGRVRSVLDERWGDNIYVSGVSLDLPPGALVFQLDGRFLGMAVRLPAGGTAIIPAGMLEAAVVAARARPPGGGP